MCSSFRKVICILSTTTFYILNTAWTKDILKLEKTLMTVTERETEQVKYPSLQREYKKSH